MVNNEPVKRLNPLDNFLFLKVMGQKGDEKQLIGFLNAVLGRTGKNAVKTVFLNEKKEFLKDFINSKSCNLDVLAVLEDGSKVNIEVQLRNKYNTVKRNLFYWGKIYTDSLDEGKNYRILPKVILITIVDFDFPKIDKVHSSFHLWEDEKRELMLDEVLEIHYINMVKWRERAVGKETLNDPLNRWLVWFNEESPPELVEEVLMIDPAIIEAKEKLDSLLANDWEAREYLIRREIGELDRINDIYAREEEIKEALAEARAKALAEGHAEGRAEGRAEGHAEGHAEGRAEGHAKGLAKGREEGHAKGHAEEKIRIAKNALAKGAAIEFVMEITGLDMEIIKQLVNG